MPKKHRLGKSLCFYIQSSQMIKRIFRAMIITRTSLNGKKYPPLSPVGAMKIARSPGF